MLQKIIDAPRKIQDIPKAVTKDFYCNLVRIRCNFRQNLKTAFIPFEKIHIPNSRKKAVYQSRKFACHSRKFVYSISYYQFEKKHSLPRSDPQSMRGGWVALIFQMTSARNTLLSSKSPFPLYRSVYYYQRKDAPLHRTLLTHGPDKTGCFKNRSRSY